MAYQVAKVRSLVKVGNLVGNVITGVMTHLVDEGGGGGGANGVAPEIEIFEDIGMETEDMTPAERRAYLNDKYGAGTADSLDRASQISKEDAGSESVTHPDAKSKSVSCGEFTNSTPDSTKISRYFTVADFSSNAKLPHAIPNTTAKNMSRADVICNLKHLAANSIDPLRDWLTKKGYTMQIGSAFRNASGTSDHNIGSACDIYVLKGGSRVSREEIRNVARDMLNGANLPFTQFLLEFAGDSSLGWMHIANRKAGNNSALRVGYSLDNSQSFHPNIPKTV